MFSCASEYQQALQNAFAGEDISVFAYRELDSTNTEAKRLALGGGNAPAVIAAESQTAGRGRMGRSFYSPLQTGAYFSFLYQPSAGLDVAVSVTSAVSVAVAEAILALCGVQCEIKWVNDLYCNGKKVCGILCESVTVGDRPMIVVGIGINLCTAEFPPDLLQKAGSIGRSVDKSRLIAAVWKRLKPYLNDPQNRDWLPAYRAYSCVIGKRVEWQAGGVRFCGVAEDIDADGGLCVQTPDGRHTVLRTGEISLFIEGVNLL